MLAPRRPAGVPTGDYGVGVIGHVRLATRQHPRDPRIDCANAEVVGLSRFDFATTCFHRALVRCNRDSVLASCGHAFANGTKVLPTEPRPTGSPDERSQTTVLARCVAIATPVCADSVHCRGNSS